MVTHLCPDMTMNVGLGGAIGRVDGEKSLHLLRAGQLFLLFDRP